MSEQSRDGHRQKAFHVGSFRVQEWYGLIEHLQGFLESALEEQHPAIDRAGQSG